MGDEESRILLRRMPDLPDYRSGADRTLPGSRRSASDRRCGRLASRSGASHARGRRAYGIGLYGPKSRWLSRRITDHQHLGLRVVVPKSRYCIDSRRWPSGWGIQSSSISDRPPGPRCPSVIRERFEEALVAAWRAGSRMTGSTVRPRRRPVGAPSHLLPPLR